MHFFCCLSRHLSNYRASLVGVWDVMRSVNVSEGRAKKRGRGWEEGGERWKGERETEKWGGYGETGKVGGRVQGRGTIEEKDT